MNICIGIISWFPDNGYRQERVGRCRKIIDKCNELLELPIVVVAQNWHDEIAAKNITRLDYPKLGITNARKVLWQYFKNSNFDWMICFDDDSLLEGSRIDGQAFISFLQGKHDGYTYSRKYEFKLCAFHHSIADKVDFPNLDVDEGTGIEDYGFFRMLEIKHQELYFPYDWKSLTDARRWIDDKTSCWHRHNVAQLIKSTNKYLKKINGLYAQRGKEK